MFDKLDAPAEREQRYQQVLRELRDNGRLALLSAAIALVCADYFLQEPLYSLANDDPREYGDLFVFALLAVTAIKFVRVLVRPHALLGTKSRAA